METMRRKKKKLSKLKITLIVLSVILAIILGYIGYTAYKIYDTANQIHTPIKPSDKRADQEGDLIEKGEAFSVLLLGIDATSKNPNDKGRSDAIIIYTINPKTNSTKTVSIPRDTQADIVGYNSTPSTKINAAYAFGGEEMATRTIENFLDIPIDYYIKADMDSFPSIVDSIGGITIDNHLDFTQNGFHFPIGTVNLDGDKALAYTRMRKQDPRGDFGRQQRQRMVLQALQQRAKSPSIIFGIHNLLDTLGTRFTTNLTFDQLMDLQKKYIQVADKMETIEIEATNARINGASMQVISQKERDRVSKILRSELELD